ncbi:hypothetical protein SRB5_65390 [Streptomyces sp. RB5]|uniref:YwqJ-like deaminase n=1 Tax=Streptomyces smaragdinus TaxID=2585196 RepID=A0A7K0CSA9_9ACTN|nr:YwqJ-related putative deaminase [Streptomyces smaragdinus]MQY16341.1 hypothetical protein [Streptomyces smaragdinus]
MTDALPTTASSLLVRGAVHSMTSLTGPGEPELHPLVRAFLDALPPAEREPFAAYCSETALVSDQLWALDEAGAAPATLADARPHFAGAVIVSRKIREQGDPEHGTNAPVCRTCAALLDTLGVEVMAA